MNKELLMNIFRIPAETGGEKAMATFIKSYLKKNSIKYKEDKKGNIYNVSHTGNPILSSHMDTVQDKYDMKLTNFIKIRGNVLSGYGVIGGDDKCGIYIILDLVTQVKNLNFIFSVEEESGGDGIRTFVSNNDLTGITYGLVLDRRGNSDIICCKNDYGIKKFENLLLEVGKVFGYSVSSGTFSDADYLSDKISCANVSVGYYNPHSKDEFVLLDDLEKACHFVFSIIKNIKEKFAKPLKYNYKKSRFNYYSYDNSYYSSTYDKCFICNKEKTKLIYLAALDKYTCKSCALNFARDLEWQGELKNIIDEMKVLEDYNDLIDCSDIYDENDIDFFLDLDNEEKQKEIEDLISEIK